jgi:hypothetical protein
MLTKCLFYAKGLNFNIKRFKHLSVIFLCKKITISGERGAGVKANSEKY